MNHDECVLNASNLYYLAFYQDSLDQLNTIYQSKKDSKELLLLVCRVMLSLEKFDEVRTFISQSNFKDDQDVTAMLKLTNFFNSKKDKDLKALETIHSNNPSVYTAKFLATAYLCTKNYEKGLELLNNKDLETVALKIQTFLLMNRIDLASSTLEDAKSWADDVPLIQVVEALLDLKQGADRSQSALFAFEELENSNKDSISYVCMNGKAIAQIQLQQYEDIDQSIYENCKNNPALLTNAIVVSILSKNQIQTEKYNKLIKTKYPAHDYTLDLISKELFFDKCASHYLESE